MSNEEIIEGNKLIAVFMGKLTGIGIPLSTFNYYHKDWNRLMPVVEKIGRLYDKAHLKEMSINSLSVFSPIETVFTCVIQFIKWYNQNNSNPTKTNTP